MTDEELIARMREVGDRLSRRPGDLDRLAGWLLKEAAGRLEDHVIQRDALDTYARQNADVHRENLRLLDRIAELEALAAAQVAEAEVWPSCRRCGRSTASVPCDRCGGPACSVCGRCPPCDGDLPGEEE